MRERIRSECESFGGKWVLRARRSQRICIGHKDNLNSFFENITSFLSIYELKFILFSFVNCTNNFVSFWIAGIVIIWLQAKLKLNTLKKVGCQIVKWWYFMKYYLKWRGVDHLKGSVKQTLQKLAVVTLLLSRSVLVTLIIKI